ncbi:MAG: hypothetical protein FJY75_06000 [Candidatus Eisenbacteria bacterium]|uniref:Type IV pilus assembly protein PilM n=1 Tax=Eiseniibacteriota bacterium TaxID=2212470 RepID=A0A938BQN7_UNCEI|nr:hypothetical protein [Candidatus Eisenbacteria bacterium]
MSTTPADRRRRLPALPIGAAARSPIGLEAGGDTLRFARATVRGESAVWRTGRALLPPEAVRDGKAARRRLRELAREAGIPRGPARLVLASPAIDIFPLTLPPGEAGTLDARVVAQAREQLHYPLAEAVLDYLLLPEAVRRQGEEEEAVLVFCAPRALAEVWVDRLDRIGLVVESLTTPGCALAPWLRTAVADIRRLVIVAAEEATSIAVVQLGTVLLERILPWGSRAWTDRLRSELDLDERHCLALLEQPDPPAAVGDILGPLCEELAREADGCLAYCDSYLVARPPASVLLLGTLAGCAPLRAFLERALQVPVRAGHDELPLPGGDDRPPAAFAAAACAALRPEAEEARWAA